VCPDTLARSAGACQGGKVKITHLGHACVLVETGGTRILIDPGAFTPGFTETADLDAVLITHQHQDHLDIERLPVLLEGNEGVRLLAEPETTAELGKAGIEAEALHVDSDFTLGPDGLVRLRPVGGIHAEITPDIPRIGNVGLLLSVDGEPTFFHPGDTYEYTPEGVDVLAVPLTAPWTKLSETVAFARTVRPARMFPVHDAILAPLGRNLYLNQLKAHVPDTEVLDLASAGATTF
jgi:L-ascorbate metabolism protein UlaG (beta-lactamase superfamily)